MRDFYPEQMRIRSWLFSLWRETAMRYGFEEYDSSIVEHEEIYILESGQEILGQLFNFKDKGDRRVALRPEMTPTLARMFAAKGQNLVKPLKWFSIAQCFRYERMSISYLRFVR
jgi:histidyl-tRNA synthetase